MTGAFCSSESEYQAAFAIVTLIGRASSDVAQKTGFEYYRKAGKLRVKYLCHLCITVITFDCPVEQYYPDRQNKAEKYESGTRNCHNVVKHNALLLSIKPYREKLRFLGCIFFYPILDRCYSTPHKLATTMGADAHRSQKCDLVNKKNVK